MGNREIPKSHWPISLIFPGAPEKVTQKNIINIILTYNNKVVTVLTEHKLTRMSVFRQRAFLIFSFFDNSKC